jgi:carboxymethylenebutenolidase
MTMLDDTHNTPLIPQEAFDWYDEYAHGIIDRREFMRRLSALTVAGLTITTLASSLIPNYAMAEQVSSNDPMITASDVKYPSPNGYGEGAGYLVAPTTTGPHPVVLVIHENRGLNPYIKDVARRLAKAGFIALAPDALYPVGGYPGNDDQGRERQKELDAEKIEQDFLAAAHYLKNLEQGSGKMGAVGFCFGGYIVNMLAATIPDALNAGVPFYGTPAKDDLRDNIKGPLMLHFAELDTRVNATWPAYEQHLKENQVPYQAFIYQQANHGFHNDSTARYEPKEAELAWSRTIEFFKLHLS